MKETKNIEAKVASKVENTSVAAQAEVANIEPKVKKDKKDKKSKKEKKAKVLETKEAKKAKVTKEVAAQQKEAILEEVISKREVKYIYPEDVKDTLARKTWRQKTRNELHRLELAVSRIKDTNSKEYKKAKKEYEAFKATVLKPEQVA